MKARTFIPLAVLALACGSSTDDKGKALAGGTGATGGTGASGGTGGSLIDTTGGTTSGGTTSGGTTSGGNSGSGSITMETAESLRAKACAGSSSERELVPVVLMLVVDNSGSMRDRPANSDRTKWEITQEALGQALDQMPATAAVGLLFYPNMNTMGSDVPRPIDQCVNINAMIPIELLGDPNSGQRGTIANALDRTEPQGSTPTHDAYDYAYVNGMQASRLTGNRFMLLITDGAPTLKKECQGGGMPDTPQPTQPIISEILSVRQSGVRSFIIGSPGSESVNNTDLRPWLSEAAVDGGTARSGCSLYGPDYCHIDLSQDPDFAGALNSALARILGIITSCTFDVPSNAPDGKAVQKDQVNVIYSSGDSETLVGRDDTTGCTDGWQYDADGKVVLCSNTCATVQNDPDARIELLFGCDAVDVEPVK